VHIPDTTLLIVILAVGLALAFGFLSAYHDAADAIATVVSTRALKPYQAVVLAAACNGLAVFFFPLDVAATLANGLIDSAVVDVQIVLAVLLATVGWSLVAVLSGMSASVTHALLGALLGASVIKSGSTALVSTGVIKILAFVLLTPLLGFVLGTLVLVVVAWMSIRSTPRRAEKGFRRLQLLSAGVYNLAHGANNAQKCLGMLWMLSLAIGALDQTALPARWTIWGSYGVVAAGTFLGGWRVVKTMGQRLTHLKPVSGFCAESGAAVAVILINNMGIPVSPRQALTGAIIGVGSARRMTAVRWNVVTSMIRTLALTIPTSAFAGAVAWWLLDL